MDSYLYRGAMRIGQHYYLTQGIQSMLKRATIIKKEYIDKGKMGMSSGEGFYKYPNPRYEDHDFLKYGVEK